MTVTLENTGKKFGSEWIFRHVSHTFSEGSKTVILGSNGSGKSTLLQVVSGYVIPTEGKVNAEISGKPCSQEDIHRQFAFASPYQELLEDFTLREMIRFQGQFRAWKSNLSEKEIVELSGLSAASDKLIRHYSSGMKQRVKLILAVLMNAPVLLLDEPCSNLDKQGMEWYSSLIRNFCMEQTVIVCSNEVKEEYFFAGNELRMSELKP